MKKLHLWKDELIESDGTVTAGVTIECDGGSSRKLWYRVPSRFANNLSETCNAFVVGMVLTAMRESSDLIVHGDVSSRLLENLEEFRAAWVSWRPERYSRIEIVADNEIDRRSREKSNNTIVAFSGGVDASFTAYRHVKGLCGRLKKDIKTGMFIHGFNIGLDRNDIYDKVADRAEMMLGSLDIELIRMATNYRDLGDNFGDSHVAEIASCMLLFENSYSTGLIAGSQPYAEMTLPWGSNPITDRLLSSDRLEFIHDGAAYTRSEKIEVISDWQEALKYLWVCYQSDNLDKNCCKCEKCIRTILNFRALGLDLPECFEHDATDEMILNMKRLKPIVYNLHEDILSQARHRSISGSWVSALEKSVKRNKRAQAGWRRKIYDMRNKYAIKTRLKKYLSGK